MSETMLHPKPRWSAVAREQFRAVGLATRRDWLLFGLGLGGLTVLFALLYARARAEGGSFSFDFTPGVAIPLTVLGFIAPLSVWKAQEPSRRGYLWSLPPERGGHTLLRNFNGWVWFMALIAVYMLWALLMAWATGGDIGISQSTVMLAELPRVDIPSEESIQRVRAVMGEDSNFLRLRWAVPGWQWAVPFVAATAMYLLGSIIALASDHPMRWLGGILVGLFLLAAVVDATEWHGLIAVLESISDGRYGTNMLFDGNRGVAQQFTTRAGETVVLTVARPDLATWLATAAIWLGLGTAGTLVVAFRHQER